MAHAGGSIPTQYSNITISENAQAHLGDSYVTNIRRSLLILSASLFCDAVRIISEAVAHSPGANDFITCLFLATRC